MASSRADDTTLLGVLCEMGLVSAEDKPSIEYLLEEENPSQEDIFVAAFLINNEYITERQLREAESIQKQLLNPDPVERTKARVSMVKEATRHVRAQIRNNTALSRAILKDGKELKKKSSSSEYVAVGFRAAKSGMKL